MEEFDLVQPFKGFNINGTLHKTIQTGALIETLQHGAVNVLLHLRHEDHAPAFITETGTATVVA